MQLNKDEMWDLGLMLKRALLKRVDVINEYGVIIGVQSLHKSLPSFPVDTDDVAGYIDSILDVELSIEDYENRIRKATRASKIQVSAIEALSRRWGMDV